MPQKTLPNWVALWGLSLEVVRNRVRRDPADSPPSARAARTVESLHRRRGGAHPRRRGEVPKARRCELNNNAERGRSRKQTNRSPVVAGWRFPGRKTDDPRRGSGVRGATAWRAVTDGVYTHVSCNSVEGNPPTPHPLVLAFGKYKGKHLDQVPQDYLSGCSTSRACHGTSCTRSERSLMSIHPSPARTKTPTRPSPPSSFPAAAVPAAQATSPSTASGGRADGCGSATSAVQI